jgi:hypothetical protein
MKMLISSSVAQNVRELAEELFQPVAQSYKSKLKMHKMLIAN